MLIDFCKIEAYPVLLLNSNGTGIIKGNKMISLFIKNNYLKASIYTLVLYIYTADSAVSLVLYSIVIHILVMLTRLSHFKKNILIFNGL